MSYAEKFLLSRGQPCTINRTPNIASKVSIKRTTRSSRDLGSREAYCEGLILSDVQLQSGEILTIGVDKYLVQSVNIDPASKECIFFAAKTNAVLQHKRETETLDDNGNVIKSWSIVNADVDVYIEVATYELRQYDPGLLEQTRYIAQAPKSINAEELDRFTYGDKNLKAVSIDPMALKGVIRIQMAFDERP